MVRPAVSKKGEEGTENSLTFFFTTRKLVVDKVCINLDNLEDDDRVKLFYVTGV